MRNVIILGTGGCASEVTFYIEDSNKRKDAKEKIHILGYIENEDRASEYYNRYNFKAPILFDIDSYEPSENEEILIAISAIDHRKRLIKILEEKGARIGTFIHPSSIVPDNNKIGKGNIICPFCIIEDYAQVGNYNLLTSYSFISHDCVVGDNNFLSTAGLAGNVKVGNNNYFGLRSAVIPGKEIGNNNIVQAGMTIDKNVKDDTTVFYRYKEQVLAIPKK